MDEKDKVLNNLYALRAGLSVISQEYDKAKGIEDDCNARLEENAYSLAGELTCYDDNISASMYAYPELVRLQGEAGYERGLENAIEYRSRNDDGSHSVSDSDRKLLEKNYKAGRRAYCRWLACEESDAFFKLNYGRAESNKKSADSGFYVGGDHTNWKKERTRSILLSVLFFLLAMPALAVMGVSLHFGVASVTLAFFILAACAFLILGTVFAFSAKKYHGRHVGSVEVKNAEAMRAAETLKNLPSARERARELLRGKDEKIAPIKESCNEFYFALKKQFCSLLDERDWQNLDIIIYQLETRRADSLKEALQLTDRELQTERIEQTVALATEQICHEIRRGFAELKAAVIECSKVISAQLSAVNLQLAGMGEQLSELTDSVNMGNALQAKANVTSAQLLSDVHAIRYYGC